MTLSRHPLDFQQRNHPLFNGARRVGNLKSIKTETNKLKPIKTNKVSVIVVIFSILIFLESNQKDTTTNVYMKRMRQSKQTKLPSHFGNLLSVTSAVRAECCIVRLYELRKQSSQTTIRKAYVECAMAYEYLVTTYSIYEKELQMCPCKSL